MTTEPRVAKALAHPLRARILQRLGERVASPADLATELGAPLGVVAYHVRMLRDYDCVELVRTEPRRGALQHFYRATTRPGLDEDQWRRLPSSLRGELTGETLDTLMSDLATAAAAGTLEDSQVVLSRIPLELDQRGFKKLNKLLTRTREQAVTIAAETAARHTDPQVAGRLRDRVGAAALQASDLRPTLRRRAAAAVVSRHDWRGVMTPTHDFVVYRMGHDEGLRGHTHPSERPTLRAPRRLGSQLAVGGGSRRVRVGLRQRDVRLGADRVHCSAGHSITVLAIAGGSRPASSHPAAVAASGTPTTARAR